MLICGHGGPARPAISRSLSELLPTLLVLRHGERVGSLVGARPKNQLRRALERHLEA